MGLFGGETKIYVASSIYNMAGDYTDRTNYMKFLVLSGLHANNTMSLGDVIRNGIINGPAMKLRAFYRWSTTNYQRGMPSTFTSNSVYIPPNLVAAAISSAPNTEDYIETVYIGRSDHMMFAERYIMNNYPGRISTNWDADIRNGVITITWADGTTTNITPGDWVGGAKYLYARYRIITKNGSGKYTAVSNPKIFIYRMNSGVHPNLDKLDDTHVTFRGFYPVIPVRAYNQFITQDPSYDDSQAIIEKAWKKASGHKLSEIIEKLKDNDKLEDIDHATIFFGVPLNTRSQASKKYIYEFLRDIMNFQKGSEAAYLNYGNAQSLYQEYVEDFNAWIRDVRDGGTMERPPAVVQPQADESAIRMKCSHTDFDHMDLTIEWKYIKESFHTGKGKTNAKLDEVWIEKRPSVIHQNGVLIEDDGNWNTLTEYVADDVFEVFHQYEAQKYKKLRIVGMRHINEVYGDKQVRIKPEEALNDAEESGFFFPLVYSTFRSLPLTDQHQMSSEVTLLVLNCYVKKKLKWYQTGFFQVLLFFGAILLSAFTGGAALGAAGGILGTNAVIGAALGFSGAAAAIAGAVANALAAMIITKIITAGLQAILPGQLGAILGTILAVVTLTVGTNFAMTGQFHWESLLTADNLIRLTDATFRGFANSLHMDTADLYAQLQEKATEYEQRLGDVQDLYAELVGQGSNFNPIVMTDSVLGAYEKPKDFLARTQMVGSDIATLTHQLITNFVEETLRLDTGV